MPPKEKKSKKSKKAEEEDQQDSELTAVDKQFYELTIADINKKLTRLRAHNVKIEEKNEELEARMKQMEEDRQDVTAYLNRTLHEKVNIIQELEDKLTELSKVRRDENENFKKRMNEWENKFKMMHDNLSSEIKLLTGKLNSMEEFRLQRDDLMAKFDTQEQEIKEQAKKHKAILYEMERKVILDKERMRKDVENKLLELSTEFTKTSDLRVAASTQRLVRENIALNNDMDRMMFTLERLQKENEEMKKKHREIAGQHEVNVAEKKRLIKTGEQQLAIIKKLTTEYEDLRDQNAYLKEIKRGHEVARKMTKDNRSELMDLKEKIRILEQHIHVIDCDRQQLKADTIYHRQEYERVSSIIKSVRLTVKSAIRGDLVEDDPAFRESQRKNLLTDLLNILNDLEKHGRKQSLETIPSISDFYSQGDLGIIPKDDADTIIQNMPKLKIDETFLTPSVHSADGSDDANHPKIDSDNELIDPATASGSIFFASDAEGESVDQESEHAFQQQLRKTQMLSIDLRKSLEQESEVEDEENKEVKEEAHRDGEVKSEGSEEK